MPHSMATMAGILPHLWCQLQEGDLWRRTGQDDSAPDLLTVLQRNSLNMSFTVHLHLSHGLEPQREISG